MRARLSLLPSSANTSKIPGLVVRPVNAARSGWASFPSFTPSDSATWRTDCSSASWFHSASPSALCARESRARLSVGQKRGRGFVELERAVRKEEFRAFSELVEIVRPSLKLGHGPDEKLHLASLEPEFRADEIG